MAESVMAIAYCISDSAFYLQYVIVNADPEGVSPAQRICMHPALRGVRLAGQGVHQMLSRLFLQARSSCTCLAVLHCMRASYQE